MNIQHALTHSNIAWSMSTGITKTDRGTKYPCVAVTVTLEDGTALSKNFGLGSITAIDNMLISVLRESCKDHPVLLGWYSEHGNDETKLIKGALSNLGELLHVALRKCADSKQSVITWNAISKLHPDDWSALLKEAAAALRSLKKEHKKLTRLKIGKALKSSITACLERLHMESRQTRHQPGIVKIERTELQRFGLLMLLSGVEMTENSEWTWGWAGYLCEDK